MIASCVADPIETQRHVGGSSTGNTIKLLNKLDVDENAHCNDKVVPRELTTVLLDASVVVIALYAYKSLSSAALVANVVWKTAAAPPSVELKPKLELSIVANGIPLDIAAVKRDVDTSLVCNAITVLNVLGILTAVRNTDCNAISGSANTDVMLL